jgi:hypothetical protein
MKKTVKQKSKIIVLSFKRKQIVKDITNMPYKKQMEYYDIRRDNIRKQFALNVPRKDLMKMYQLNYNNLFAITAGMKQGKK